jgi:4'-phosphopantetheinyl transferase EntD
LGLFYQHNINETTRLGIWHIEEPEGFFLHKVSLQRNISHPHKRLQHLAARWLLQELFPDFPYEEILVADTRKPYLPGEQYHFSVSHCGNFAAALVSSKKRVGLDIELVSPKIASIAHKFMHEMDTAYLEASDLHGFTQDHLLAFMWSAKESLFKWYSLGGIDFKEHLQLGRPLIQTGGARVVMPFTFKKQTLLPVKVNARLFTGVHLVLAWCAT